MGRLLLLALTVFELSAATRAFLPNCCTNQNSISILDPTDGVIVKAFELGATAGPFVLSPDGRYAFVETVNASSGLISAISRFNLAVGNTTASYPLPANLLRVTQIEANPVQPILYVTYVDTAAQNHLEALTMTDLAVIRDIVVPVTSSGTLSVSPHGDRLYMGYTGLLVLDALTLRKLGTLIPNISTFGLVETSAQTELFVVARNSASSTEIDIDVVNLATSQVTLAVPVSNPMGLVLSKDETKLYLTDQSTVTILDLRTLASTDYTTIIQLSGAVAQSADGSKLYLDISENDTPGFEIFDVATATFTHNLTASPEQLAVATGGNLVMLDASSTASITDIVPSTTVARSLPAGIFVDQPALDADHDLIFLPIGPFQVMQVLDSKTFKQTAVFGSPSSGYFEWAMVAGGSLFAGLTYDFPFTSAVAQYDPVTLQQTGLFNLPEASGFNCFGGLPAAALSADFTRLYAPYDYTSFCFSLSGSGNGRSTTDVQNGLAVFDAKSGSLLNVFPFTWISGIALTDGGTDAFVTIEDANYSLSIASIDLATGAILRATVIGKGSPNYPPVLGPPQLSQDGSALYVVAGTTLFSVDATTLAITNQIANPAFTNMAISLTPNGRYLYCTTAKSVIVLDARTLSELSTITAPSQIQAPALFLEE